jgi:hypothetical protein
MADLTGHWRKQYENLFLGAWDLWDKSKNRYVEVQATIDRVTDDEVVGEGGRRSKPWQLFLTGRKGPIRVPMIVSKTSGKTLEIMYGPSPQGWVGKTITLYVQQKKRVQKGTGAVLTIRNTKGGDALKEELMQRGPAIDEDEFVEPIPEDSNAPPDR